ncbi:hypothetical protein EYC84_003442 [Monilinia fructicola]|uniref:Elongation factor 1-gamma n=1 Tax=Monilinia fructicola TaxID=38448 RepID=A0A5M9JW31_MONFR|nr:hypothetical protein EYC84_003442 [Monilinia fructicola]
MAFGTLYTLLGMYSGSLVLCHILYECTSLRMHFSMNSLLIANNIELDIVETEPAKGVSEDYLKINKLGKVPTFVGADGYTLHEAIAIAIYITSQNEKTTLLGKTKQDYASILKWMSFFNTEVISSLGGWFRPLLGRDPYNKKNVDDSIKATAKVISVIEEHLLNNTYLAGERITLADLFAAGVISRGFEFFFGKEWRAQNPNTARWYTTVYNQPIYSAVVDPLVLIDEPKLKNQAPKKAEQPKAEKPKKEAPKPKAKEHPLEALPKSTIPLDEWKRQYSNQETPDASSGSGRTTTQRSSSLWAVDYKYNDELTQTFMTSNLIGGFFARLEASRKYIFGCASVYGTANDSIIKGAFVIRGQEASSSFRCRPRL